MNLSKIRKAIVAAGSAAGSVVMTAVLSGNLPTSVEGVSALIGGAVAAGVVAGYVTWRTENAK